ncbi:MAG TPA: MoaD family protein [Dehalococcoidia bacterium]|jgi:MoaD family protein|nr:MoaD family protein [Dehalococcoidia bacterium]
MTVEVKVTANMKKLLGGQSSVEASGGTVRAVLDDVDKRYPGFRDSVMTDGGIHRFVNVYLNDEDVRFLGQLDTPLKDGDVLSVLPALAGG